MPSHSKPPEGGFFFDIHELDKASAAKRPPYGTTVREVLCCVCLTTCGEVYFSRNDHRADPYAAIKRVAFYRE